MSLGLYRRESLLIDRDLNMLDPVVNLVLRRITLTTLPSMYRVLSRKRAPLSELWYGSNLPTTGAANEVY
jgi:hypothetical protein